MAIQFKEHTSFLSTNNKNKIKVGELNCPIAAVNRERKVLVTQEQVVQAADHEFSCVYVYVYVYVCFISIWRDIALYRYIL